MDINEARRDLAATFRWSYQLGLSEGICNHYSWSVNDQCFLVNPMGRHWSEITASDMLLVDSASDVVEGEGCVEPTALFIHWRVHQLASHARCILHTHALCHGDCLFRTQSAGNDQPKCCTIHGRHRLR